jgi:hypothetical protein
VLLKNALEGLVSRAENEMGAVPCSDAAALSERVIVFGALQTHACMHCIVTLSHPQE